MDDIGRLNNSLDFMSGLNSALLKENAQLKAELETLREWKRITIGAGTDQETVIRMAASEYTQIAVQCWRQENAKLKEELAQSQQREARLREALQLLHDHQNGCPLPSYEEGWTRAMFLTRMVLREGAL